MISKRLAVVLSGLVSLSITGCSFIDSLTMDGTVLQKEDDATAYIQSNNENMESQEDNLPVIAIRDDNDAVITIEEPVEEEDEQVEYEEIFDPVAKIYSAKAENSDEITISFTGDVGFAQGYATINVYRQNGSDINNSMDPEVLEILRGSDITMINNEFPYSYRGEPTPNKTYTFRADPADVSILNDMGVDIVSLANNHAYDYGPDALLDSLETLTGASIAYVGAGANIDEAKKPAYFKVNGHTIAFVSATQIERYGNPDTREATESTPGVLRTLEPSKAVASIKEAAENSDFVVMYVHWGSESTDLVEQSQRDLAKAYAEAGADLVIGDHSHCLQGIDYVDSVPVFYSLGNFWFNSKTLDTCIVTATLDENCNIKSIKFTPCIQRGSCVRIGDGDNFDRILTYMRGISNYAEIDDEGYVTESSENHNIQNGQNTSPARKPAENTQVQPEEVIPELPLLLEAPQ